MGRRFGGVEHGEAELAGLHPVVVAAGAIGLHHGRLLGDAEGLRGGVRRCGNDFRRWRWRCGRGRLRGWGVRPLRRSRLYRLSGKQPGRNRGHDGRDGNSFHFRDPDGRLPNAGCRDFCAQYNATKCKKGRDIR